MIISALLAIITVGTHSVTFTAKATGVDTNTPLEFVFAGKDSDRDYETLFLLDDRLDEIIAAFAKAGIPSGRPVSRSSCRLWPCGVPITISPPLASIVSSEPIEGGAFPGFIYTGGSRDSTGRHSCAVEMPKALFALYDCPQSPLQFDGIFPQGLVYGHHFAKNSWKKGASETFTISWDGKTNIKPVSYKIRPGQIGDIVNQIKAESSQSTLSVLVSFDDSLTVQEAIAVSKALLVIDSTRIRINGFENGNFYYRTFVPQPSWRKRKDRLTQPFEITLGNPIRLVYIEEDWSGEGMDPKLTEREITFAQAKEKHSTDTAFVFASSDTKISALRSIRSMMPSTVSNWYVFAE